MHSQWSELTAHAGADFGLGSCRRHHLVCPRCWFRLLQGTTVRKKSLLLRAWLAVKRRWCGLHPQASSPAAFSVSSGARTCPSAAASVRNLCPKAFWARSFNSPAVQDSESETISVRPLGKDTLTFNMFWAEEIQFTKNAFIVLSNSSSRTKSHKFRRCQSIPVMFQPSLLGLSLTHGWHHQSVNCLLSSLSQVVCFTLLRKTTRLIWDQATREINRHFTMESHMHRQMLCYQCQLRSRNPYGVPNCRHYQSWINRSLWKPWWSFTIAKDNDQRPNDGGDISQIMWDSGLKPGLPNLAPSPAHSRLCSARAHPRREESLEMGQRQPFRWSIVKSFIAVFWFQPPFSAIVKPLWALYEPSMSPYQLLESTIVNHN